MGKHPLSYPNRVVIFRNCCECLIDVILSLGHDCGLLRDAAHFALTGEGPKVLEVYALVRLIGKRESTVEDVGWAVAARDRRFRVINAAVLLYIDNTRSQSYADDAATCVVRLRNYLGFFDYVPPPKNPAFSHAFNGHRIAPFSAVVLDSLEHWVTQTDLNFEQFSRLGKRIERMLAQFSRYFSGETLGLQVLRRYHVLQTCLRMFFFVLPNPSTIDISIDMNLLQEMQEFPMPQPLERSARYYLYYHKLRREVEWHLDRPVFHYPMSRLGLLHLNPPDRREQNHHMFQHSLSSPSNHPNASHREIPDVSEAARAVLIILERLQFGAVIFGSLACYTYGATRMPKDVDFLVFRRPSFYPEADAERIKRIIVTEDSDCFFLKDARDPDAPYRLLHYRFNTTKGDNKRKSCKIDILLPGVMHLPQLANSDVVWIHGFPFLPFSILLLQKLQSCNDNRHSPEFWKRKKQRIDAKDIHTLLKLPRIVELRAQRPWSDRSLFTEVFMMLSRERTISFCSQYPHLKTDWRLLGFRADPERVPSSYSVFSGFLEVVG